MFPSGSLFSVFTDLNAPQRAAGIVSDHELNERDAPLPISSVDTQNRPVIDT
jgi:hypothetical protein